MNSVYVNESGYKSGFNGQVKDDEIYGEGNAYSAQFWEYDSRLGRRWNLDPKPNPSISDYACFANNPIFYSDPLGDTIQIKFGGFLGIGRKTATYNEKDQKFYDKKGKEINSNNKFYNEIKNGVKELNKGVEGKGLIDFLAKDDNIHKIKRSYGMPFQDSYKANNWKNSENGKGTGSSMYIFIGKNRDEPIFLGIAHEGGHSKSGALGIKSNKQWSLYTAAQSMLSEDEMYAMHYENMIRVEHGLPLRRQYCDEFGGPAIQNGTFDSSFFIKGFSYYQNNLNNILNSFMSFEDLEF